MKLSGIRVLDLSQYLPGPHLTMTMADHGADVIMVEPANGTGEPTRTMGTRADLTVCMNVITSASAAKRAALWSSLAHVTRKGGHALVVIPSLESEWLVRATAKENLEPVRKGGLVKRDDAWQKHYERAELDRIFTQYGFTMRRVDRAYYPWSIEGVRETAARAKNRPWDWMCLARKV